MRKNDEIHSELTKMIAMATTAAYTCDKLVEIENNVDNYRKNGIRKLQEK